MTVEDAVRNAVKNNKGRRSINPSLDFIAKVAKCLGKEVHIEIR